MSPEVEKVIAQLATEVQRLVQMVLLEQGISERSDLYKSVRVEIDSSATPIVISTFLDNYIQYIENGRAPKTGKKPPIDALRDWAAYRGLPTDNSTLYAISHAIWRDGIEPRPILATIQERIDQYVEQEFCDKLSEAIISELNIYFEN